MKISLVLEAVLLKTPFPNTILLILKFIFKTNKIFNKFLTKNCIINFTFLIFLNFYFLMVEHLLNTIQLLKSLSNNNIKCLFILYFSIFSSILSLLHFMILFFVDSFILFGKYERKTNIYVYKSFFIICTEYKYNTMKTNNTKTKKKTI